MNTKNYFRRTQPGPKYSIEPAGYSKHCYKIEDLGYIDLEGIGEEAQTKAKIAWEIVKDKLYTFRILGNSLLKMLGMTENLRRRALAVKPELVSRIDDTATKLNSMKLLWNKVIDKINTYETEWQKLTKFFGFGGIDGLEDYEGAENYNDYYDLGDLALIGIPIAIAAIVGLTFVAKDGMALLRDYSLQRQVLQSLEREIISAEQAAVMMKAIQPVKKPFLSLFSGKSGVVLGIGTLAALLLFSKKIK